MSESLQVENIKSRLRQCLNAKRYSHSIGTMEVCLALSKHYGYNEDKAEIAGLLHDCAKNLGSDILFNIAKENELEPDEVQVSQPGLLHGVIGAVIAKKDYGIYDDDILHAIKFHTTGCKNMSILDKIVYIADYIEPGRDFKGIGKLRSLVYEDMDAALLNMMNISISYIIKRGQMLHIDTIEARNSIIILGGKPDNVL
jgi:predicted HD superfamily hydrolase involved in NAD metabolism